MHYTYEISNWPRAQGEVATVFWETSLEALKARGNQFRHQDVKCRPASEYDRTPHPTHDQVLTRSDAPNDPPASGKAHGYTVRSDPNA